MNKYMNEKMSLNIELVFVLKWRLEERERERKGNLSISVRLDRLLNLFLSFVLFRVYRQEQEQTNYHHHRRRHQIYMYT